ncbi:MAG TPA: acyltransferase [Cellvibrionaceae bacterium]
MDITAAAAASSSRNNHTFYVLDSLRGIAALSIAFLHLGTGIFNGCYLAVDFFFVLSGFILAYSYHDETRLTRTPVEFVINRIARLYPLHIVTFILFAMIFYIDRGMFPHYGTDQLFSIFQQITMTHNVGFYPAGGTWNHPSWSISVEFWVGIIFIGFIRPTTSSFKLILTSLAIMVFLGGYLDNLDVSHQNFYAFINSGILRCLASFLAGILAFRSWRIMRKFELSFLVWSAIELATLFLVYLLMFVREAYHSEIDFFAPATFYVAVLVFSRENGILSKILFNFRYLGKISYSIYLNHLPVMIFVRYLDNRHGWFSNSVPIIFFFSLLGFSALTYHLIEIPSKKLLQNILIRLTSAAQHNQAKTGTI